MPEKPTVWRTATVRLPVGPRTRLRLSALAYHRLCETPLRLPLLVQTLTDNSRNAIVFGILSYVGRQSL